MAKKEFNLTDNRFGALGWKIIVVVSLAFFFSTGITSDGLNVSVPAFVELHGWDREYLLTFSSIGGLVGVVGTILLGRLCTKIGAVNTMRICLLGLGVMLILWGRVTEIWQYGVCICLVMSLMNGYVYVSAPALLGNYFPRKRPSPWAGATWAPTRPPRSTCLSSPTWWAPWASPPPTSSWPL